MALGRMDDINLTATATLSGGNWPLPGLGLDNLKSDERYVMAPARCPDVSDLADTQFEVDLPTSRVISMIAVLFHTLNIAARYRLTVAGVDRDLDNPVFATPWTPVYQRMFPSASRPWDTTNWWGGQPTAEEINLLPRHLWIPFAPQLCGRYRLEFDDRLSEVGHLDVGGLWTSAGFSTAINFERGRRLGLKPRDIVDEGPSGRLFGERRRPRRTLALTWAALTTAEAYRFYDAGLRAGTTRTVLFVPDSDSQPALIREAFPAVFQSLPEPTFTYERSNQVAATLTEILA